MIIPDFKNTEQKLVKILYNEENKAIEQLKQNQLYFVHYTNANAAYNIINKEEMWLRNVQGMNDYREIDYGRTQLINTFENQLYRDKLEALIKAIDSSKTYVDFCRVCNAYIQDIETRTYISCLSEHPSSENNYGRLSMWRAYTKSTGIALVISPKFLDAETVFQNNIFLTTPVVYSDEAFIKIIPSILKKLDSEDFISYFKYRGINYFFHILSRYIYVCIISIKHPGFKEEREWRIILSSYSKGDEQYINNKIIKSEVETQFGHPEKIYKINLKAFDFMSNNSSRLLEKIIIGPSENANMVKEAFIHLLTNKKINNPESLIQISDIPLR